MIFLWAAIFMPLTSMAQELRVQVTQGQVAPTPIAILAMTQEPSIDQNIGKSISQVVRQDLHHCGLFKSLDPKIFVQDGQSMQTQPHYNAWRMLGAQMVLYGKVEPSDDQRIKVTFTLADVITEKILGSWSMEWSQAGWRRMAHKVADTIYKRVTGEEGYFDTRIAYVSQVGPRKKLVKRIAIMDQDGHNHAYLTTGQTLVLTPRFSPDNRSLAYLDFISNVAKVWRMDIASQKKELLGRFQGISFAPRFSPSGNSVVMSLAKDGNTSLYLMDLVNKQSRRLTHDPVIDTSPTFDPTGEQICFSSDRSGRTHLYLLSMQGQSDPQRISFGQGSYRTPVWSPRGDAIAFTKIHQGTFYIGVMAPDGSGERLLAQGWVVEDPCWSPNGRLIMFTRRTSNGSSRIYTIDITGQNEREVITPTDASGGSWSSTLD